LRIWISFLIFFAVIANIFSIDFSCHLEHSHHSKHSIQENTGTDSEKESFFEHEKESKDSDDCDNSSSCGCSCHAKIAFSAVGAVAFFDDEKLSRFSGNILLKSRYINLSDRPPII